MSGGFGKGSITRLAFALVIVSFLLSTAVSLVSLHSMNQRNVREMNRVLATQVHDFIRSELSGPITAARTMAANSFLIDTLQQEAQLGEGGFAGAVAEYLSGIEDGLGYQSAFVISDSTGRYYTRSGYARTIQPGQSEQDAWYSEFIAADAPYGLDVDNDETNKNDLTVYVNARVESEAGDYLGLCGLGVRMTGIQEFFSSVEGEFNVKVDLVSSDGIVQIDTNNASIEAVDLSSLIRGKNGEDYVFEDLGGDNFAVTKYLEDLGWYLVVRSDGAHDVGSFANVIVLNVGICLFVLIALFVALRINARHTNELTAASLIDQPTMLFNKRAFERDKAQLSAQGLDSESVLVIADVNGLKTVNDTLGHDAGDELIRGAADCLRTCFDPFGKLYRVGGDEFAAILRLSASAQEMVEKELLQIASAWSGGKVSGVSISCGYASAREFPHESVEGLLKIADERMYAEKGRHYEASGELRR